MKKILFVLLLGLLISSNSYANSLDGLWNFRANGTAVGYMDLIGNQGVIRLGSSQEDSVLITELHSTGSMGAQKIHIVRKGSYNHEFIGWLSYDGKHMAGYYIHNGQELPWSAVK